LLDDPQLGGKRKELIALASKKLADTTMITYDVHSGQLQITDLGRIAAKYYIRQASIEIFNLEFRPKMSEADVFGMLSKSTEVVNFTLVGLCADTISPTVRPNSGSRN